MAEPRISLTIDGRPYVLFPRQIDAWTGATFQAETGTSVEALLEAVDDATDPTASADGELVLAAKLCYLCVLQSDPEATFREVASAIRYDSDFGKIEATGFGPDGADEPEPELEEELEPTDPPTGPDGSESDEPGS